MSRYRLLALDLDGTLLNGESEISPGNAEWVRRAREAGIVVILSTGRGADSASEFARQLELDTPMITLNGGEIWRGPNELFRRTPLEASQIKELHRLARRSGDVWYWAYSTEGLCNKEKWPEDIESREWLKFGFYSEELDQIRAILEEIRTWDGLELSNSSPYNIEINPAGVSKAAAMEEVCRLVGCRMSEAVAMGDSLNDIAAIRASGLGIAMGNAQEEVKQAADAVTSSHLEDGVARAIRDFVLKA
ncbi:Cof-type HAD-IIB family hydrolase [Cohnella caldifontis]|uniref:Cof-type HAD-IIB family hydrolase n=1 Tax=Cohnella caldifontis TaxID=3027471 RepID=UPI0023ECC9D2|nr:Cof-type HAD-IIB family hydrolase [Cohnella sp. YIM B05605]